MTSPSPYSSLAAELRTRHGLTRREEDILCLVLQGKKYLVIAQVLAITKNTVKTHTKEVYSKLGISGRAELATLLIRSTDRT